MSVYISMDLNIDIFLLIVTFIELPLWDLKMSKAGQSLGDRSRIAMTQIKKETSTKMYTPF